MKAIAHEWSPTTFSFNDTQHIRVDVGPDGAPMFCAKDVCTILGYANDSDAIRKHCREAGVAKRDLRSGGQRRSLAFIDEGNLYRLILKSRLPAAQRFEAWVCDEVLPAIRQHGVYAASAPARNRPPASAGAEMLTANDMANLRRLVWLVAGINLYEECWTRAVWKALRAATGTQHRAGLSVEHLPLIEAEIRAIAQVALEARAMTDRINDAALKLIESGGGAEGAREALRKAAVGGKGKASLDRWHQEELRRLVQRLPAIMDHPLHDEGAAGP